MPASPELLFLFPAGTIIWPENSSQGSLTTDIIAKRIGRKIKELSGFQANSQLILYKNQRYWILPAGSCFGAYRKNARPKK